MKIRPKNERVYVLYIRERLRVTVRDYKRSRKKKRKTEREVDGIAEKEREIEGEINDVKNDGRQEGVQYKNDAIRTEEKGEKKWPYREERGRKKIILA